MKTMKKIVALAMAMMMAMSMSITALAASWQNNAIGWWWQNDDGSWPANSWQWLDGNKDGVAECYYFNGDGYMLANTTTPDGYTVNADGAWTVNGIVQMQGAAVNNGNTGATNTGSYDTQYPLAGMLDQLGLNFGYEPAFGTYELFWSSDYQQKVMGPDEGDAFIWQKTKETNNLNYWTTPNTYDEMLAIAKLAGENVTVKFADEAKAEALANNIRDFFKAFPNWKTASDYEKACHIARWIEQADYDNNASRDGNHTSYACLIEKNTVCNGYYNAAKLLAHCVGLEVTSGFTTSANHVYPVFNINGVWLEYDASGQGRETSFYINDVYGVLDQRAVELGIIDLNKDNPGFTYKYFKDRGYVVPTRLNDRFDSSLIKSVGAKGITQDALKLQ